MHSSLARPSHHIVPLLFFVIVSHKAITLARESNVLFKPWDYGLPCWRIPAAVTVTNPEKNLTRILVFAEGRYSNGDGCEVPNATVASFVHKDPCKGYYRNIFYRYSDGDGKPGTWSDITKLAGSETDCFTDPAPLFYRDPVTKATKVLVQYSAKGGAETWQHESTDDGETFDSKGKLLNRELGVAAGKRPGPAGGLFLHESGRLMVAGYAGKHDPGVSVWYSDDGGKRWDLANVSGSSLYDTNTSFENVTESVLVRLPISGDVLLSMRVDSSAPRRAAVAVVDEDNRAAASRRSSSPLSTVSASSSSRRSSSPLSTMSASSSPSPSPPPPPLFNESAAPLGARLPSTSTGDMGSLLASGDAVYYSMALAPDQSRSRMTVLMSFDDASTWTRGTVVYDGPSAYSDLATLADDRSIGIAYERDAESRATCEGASCTIVFATIAKELPPFPPPEALTTHAVETPSAMQLERHEMEMASMITFNLQTLCSQKNDPTRPDIMVTDQQCQVASAGYVPTIESVEAWHPFALDTDEWARVTAAFGAKYVILVADHMTGFALWDTAAHNYSIAHTQRGGDVVREMIASCKKYGLKLGVFYSIHYNWYLGVDDWKVGHPPLGNRNYTQNEYEKIASGQIRELLKIVREESGEDAVEIWFDGGVVPIPQLDPPIDTRKRILKVMDEFPNTLCHGCFGDEAPGRHIRWMGNEAANQALPSWMPVTTNTVPWTGSGNATGTSYAPPACDTPLRTAGGSIWFWQAGQDSTVKSTKGLVDNYLTSVGRGCNLVLNIAPDTTGAIPAVDVKRYVEMGEAIGCLFSDTLRIGGRGSGDGGAHAKTRTRTTDEGFAMDPDTGVMLPELIFDSTTPLINVTVVMVENLKDGQLIGNYSLECRRRSSDSVDGAETKKEEAVWRPCPILSLSGAMGLGKSPSIGHKRILSVGTGPARDNDDALEFDGFRVVVESHYATGTQIPRLTSVDVYDWSSEIAMDCV